MLFVLSLFQFFETPQYIELNVEIIQLENSIFPCPPVTRLSGRADMIKEEMKYASIRDKKIQKKVTRRVFTSNYSASKVIDWALFDWIGIEHHATYFDKQSRGPCQKGWFEHL